MADSDATWTVRTDEVLTMPLKVGAGPLTLFPVQGGWDGYVRERRAIMEHLDANDVENFVTLTGDAHCYIAGYQRTRYDDTLRGLLFGSAFEDDRVGVEFTTPPTTSLNVAEALGVDSGLRRRLTEPLLSWLVEAMNPYLEFFDSHHWGTLSSSPPGRSAATSATASTSWTTVPRPGRSCSWRNASRRAASRYGTSPRRRGGPRGRRTADAHSWQHPTGRRPQPARPADAHP